VTVRLVLADDHPLILDGLERLFASQPGFEVLARCEGGAEALAVAARLLPDVLLLDLHMPDLDGINVTRALREQGVPTRVVILAGSVNEREAVELLRLGVAGVVLKDMATKLLLQAVQKVAAGDVWLERRSYSQALEHLLRREAGAQRLAGRLSARELQVVRLCAQGVSNAEIAKRLSLTEGTVKSHLHKAYAKLGLHGRADLTRFAHENGLV